MGGSILRDCIHSPNYLLIIFEEVNLKKNKKDELVYQNLEYSENSSFIFFLFFLNFLIKLLRAREMNKE